MTFILHDGNGLPQVKVPYSITSCERQYKGFQNEHVTKMSWLYSTIKCGRVHLKVCSLNQFPSWSDPLSRLVVYPDGEVRPAAERVEPLCKYRN